MYYLVCPEGFERVKTKCLKQGGFRKSLSQASSICQSYGAQIYVPKSMEEMRELPYSVLGLEKSKHWIWIGLTLRNTFDKSFPPTLTLLSGYGAASWLSSDDVSDIWSDRQAANMPKRGFFKTQARQQWQSIRMKDGQWNIARSVAKFKILI